MSDAKIVALSNQVTALTSRISTMEFRLAEVKKRLDDLEERSTKTGADIRYLDGRINHLDRQQ